MSQPFTINYGPWSPDLQDVGVQMSYQLTAQTVPVADCSNVFWQDAAYRCLPSPASIGPSLGVPITNAVNWYDNSTGKEEIFAATAAGLYALVDGSWSAIPIQFSAATNAVGQSLVLTQGSPIYSTLSPAPLNWSGASSALNLPAMSVSGLSGSPSYFWYFSGTSGSANWAVASGQGTASAIPNASSATAGQTSSATLNCQITLNGQTFTLSGPVSYGYMTGSISGNATGTGTGSGTVTSNSVTASESAGVGTITYSWSVSNTSISITSPSSASTTFTGNPAAGSSLTGTATCTMTDANGAMVGPTCSVNLTQPILYTGSLKAGTYSDPVSPYTGWVGYGASLSFGTLSPTTVNGHTLLEIADVYNTSSPIHDVAVSIAASSDPGVNFFSSISANGQTFNTASASAYGYSSGVATWVWYNVLFGFTSGTTYAVTII